MAHSPTVYFTSDLHLGQAKVAGLRGFPDALTHDREVVERWLKTVHSSDRVYVLGDVTGDGRSLDLAIEALKWLPGEKHLIAGNHDACHPMNRNAGKAQRRYLEAFESVSHNARFKGYGIDVLLSHFPYSRDRGETRYPQWRLPNLGEWLLHGHTHGTERVTRWEGGDMANGEWVEDTREIHVGLDAWDLTPVHVDTIASLIKEHS